MKQVLVGLLILLFCLTLVAYAQETEEEPKPLFSWKGSGMKNTELFNIQKPWRITWTVTKELFRGAGLLQVYLNDSKGNIVALPINQLGAGEGETWMHKESGTFYFEIVSANCEWEIKVFDK
ncbi:MAG: hypothetical protein ACOYEU_01760 [Limnochordia bacterium]|jgi:hypothetical protein